MRRFNKPLVGVTVQVLNIRAFRTDMLLVARSAVEDRRIEAVFFLDAPISEITSLLLEAQVLPVFKGSCEGKGLSAALME